MKRREIILTGTAATVAGGFLLMSGMDGPTLPDGIGIYPRAAANSVWQSTLSPDAYRVLRNSGTERAGSGPFLHEDRVGIFTCGACGTGLFASTAKYDSGTGWPSFTAALPSGVFIRTDNKFGFQRDEVACSGCGSHLGHVFSDGPPPLGLRYCMNGVALKFIERV